jgi:hypothetical protein
VVFDDVAELFTRLEVRTNLVRLLFFERFAACLAGAEGLVTDTPLTVACFAFGVVAPVLAIEVASLRRCGTGLGDRGGQRDGARVAETVGGLRISERNLKNLFGDLHRDRSHDRGWRSRAMSAGDC